MRDPAPQAVAFLGKETRTYAFSTPDEAAVFEDSLA